MRNGSKITWFLIISYALIGQANQDPFEVVFDRLAELKKAGLDLIDDIPTIPPRSKLVTNILDKLIDDLDDFEDDVESMHMMTSSKELLLDILYIDREIVEKLKRQSKYYLKGQSYRFKIAIQNMISEVIDGAKAVVNDISLKSGMGDAVIKVVGDFENVIDSFLDSLLKSLGVP